MDGEAMGSTGGKVLAEGRPERPLVEVLLVGLLGLTLVAFWGFRYFPSQDGASHVYNAHVLLHLNESDAPYGAIYEPRPELVPNLLATAALVGMGKVVGLRLAERLVLSIYLLLFVAAFARLARGDTRRLPPVALLGPVFAFNYALHMGFYSFSLGAALVLWGWSVASGQRAARGLAGPLGLGVLALLAYLAHVIAAALLLLGVVVHAACAAVAERSARPVVRCLLPVVPALGLVAHYFATGAREDPAYWPLAQRLRVLAALRGLVGYTGPQEWLAILVALALILLAGFSVARGARRASSVAWLILAVSCAVAYFALPNGSSGHWYLSERLSPFAWLALVPLARVRRAETAQTVGLALLAFAFIAVTLPHQATLAARLHAREALAPLMRSGEVVLGLTFEDLLGRGPERARPLLHAAGWSAVERGLVDAGNYEAHTAHFPLRLRPGVQLPDPFRVEIRPDRVILEPHVMLIRYVVTYDIDGRAPDYRRYLERFYREIARSSEWVLFERRSAR